MNGSHESRKEIKEESLTEKSEKRGRWIDGERSLNREKKCQKMSPPHSLFFPSVSPPSLAAGQEISLKKFSRKPWYFFPADVDFFPPSEDGEKWDRIEVFFRQRFFYLVISFSLFFSEKNGTYGKPGVAFRPVGNATRIIPKGKKSPEAKLLLTSTKDPVALYVMIRNETFQICCETDACKRLELVSDQRQKPIYIRPF